MAKENRKSPKVEIAIYARHSESSGESIARQQQHCASYARSIGADEISLFSDRTGAIAVDERPGWSRLLEKCERGEVDVVVVEYFDRIARSFHLADAVINRLEKSGVKLRTASKRRVDLTSVKVRRAPRKSEGHSYKNKQPSVE
jgi:DNA invertase Pin-like site-specific DNA recombinase